LLLLSAAHFRTERTHGAGNPGFGGVNRSTGNFRHFFNRPIEQVIENDHESVAVIKQSNGRAKVGDLSYDLIRQPGP
jgi:hypothetical protein